jgi:hypothetical protein
MVPNSFVGIEEWIRLTIKGMSFIPKSNDETVYCAIYRIAKEENELIMLRNVSNYILDTDVNWSVKHPDFILLLGLLDNIKSIRKLADLALNDKIDINNKKEIMLVLSGSKHKQTIEFWREVVLKYKENFASMAVSGVLAIRPVMAVRFLLYTKPNERSQAANIIKLGQALDELTGNEKENLIKAIKAIKTKLSPQLQNWIEQIG